MSTGDATMPREKCVEDILGYILQDAGEAEEAPERVRLMRLALDVARWDEAHADAPQPVA